METTTDLRLGNCLEILDDIPNGSIDLTITSPPYDSLRSYQNTLEWGEHVWKAIIELLFEVTKDGGVVVWVVGDATVDGSETGTSFRQALYFIECGFRLHDTMIYHRQSGRPSTNRYWQNFEYMFVFSRDTPKTGNLIKDRKNKYRQRGGEGVRQIDGTMSFKNDTERQPFDEYGYRENIWYYPVGGNHMGDPLCHEHPAVFPEALAHDHIITWSNKGDTVLDPMMGSCTVGAMCQITRRNFIGIEKNPTYYELCQQRIERAKGRKGFDL